MGSGFTKVTSEYVDGDLVFKAQDGTTLLTLTGDGEALVGGVDLLAIPTSDPGDSSTIWNDSGTLKVAGAGG